MKMRLVFCAVFLLVVVIFGISAVDGAMLVPRGDTIDLRCPITSAWSNIDWAKVVPGPNSSSADYDTIAENCTVKPEYTSLYKIPATGSCNLVVVNASKPHGGRYVCYVNGVMSEEIFLSVLETNVTGSQTSDVAVGGDVVNYTCQILFYGNTGPSLYWTPGGERALSRTTLNDSIYWEVSTTEVQIPDGPATVSQTCRVANWTAGWSLIYFWQSTVITVSYCPKNVQIEGAQNGSTVGESTELKCAGEAHPPPSYLWTNAVDDSTVEGDTFTVATMKYYKLTCTVTTNVSFANGTIHTCSHQVYFEVNGTYNGSAQVNKMTHHGFLLWIAVVITALSR